jgi:SAM-dependent methyltransferase
LTGNTGENTDLHSAFRDYYERQGQSMHHQRLMYRSRHLLGDMRSETIINALSKLKPASVLDVGCAEGFYLREARMRSKQTTGNFVGVDIARSYLEKASREIEADFILADSENLPIRDGVFEAVLCSEVLEHLAHPFRALDELARISQRWLIVTTPTHTIPYYILKGFDPFRSKIPHSGPFDFIGLGGGHISELSLETLYRWSGSRGFSILSARTLHSVAVPSLTRRSYFVSRLLTSVVDKLVNLLPRRFRRGTVQFLLAERKSENNSTIALAAQSSEPLGAIGKKLIERRTTHVPLTSPRGKD